LRGVSPHDTQEYKAWDLVMHLFEILPSLRKESSGHSAVMINFLTCPFDNEPIFNLENEFREKMYMDYIADRSLALDYIKEGLELNGMCTM
jgi:hypothetical protein